MNDSPGGRTAPAPFVFKLPRQKTGEMSIARHIILSVLTLIVASGCIRENRDDCGGDVFLHFIYNGDGNTDIFPDKIESVGLYVYSVDNSAFHSEYIFDKQDLASCQGAHIILPPGEWKFVLWGNAAERSMMDKNWGTGRIAEPGHFDESNSFSGVDSLYFSTVDLTVPRTLVDVEKTCYFESSHIKMYVKLDGFAQLTDASTGETAEIVLSHLGSSEYTDFANTPSEQTCEIIPEMSPDPEDQDAYVLFYNVFRFDEDDPDCKIEIRHSDGRDIYELSLSNFIDRYDIGVNGINEVTIPILITYSETGISVVDWDIVDVNPGFE